MDPIITKILEGTPYSGMGSTLERNALIGVIRNLINESKYTVEYIISYCESVGYQRQMAEDVFKELTGLSPKLIVNNNEYYNGPSYLPPYSIAWGYSKTKPNTVNLIVPFEYGYAVMEKDEVNAPIPTVICATIPEAFDELKKVAKNIQTLDKIITKKLLETEDVPTDAKNPHQVNLPYSASPLQILKKNFKDRVLSASEFERQASKLLKAEEITVDEAEDLMNWKQELVDEDESYANEVLETNEKWNEVQATMDFEDVYNEVDAMAGEDNDFIGNKSTAKELFETNKSLFRNVDLQEAADRLYQLLLGFSVDEIKGHSKFEKKQSSKVCPNCGSEIKGYPALSRRDNKTEICSQCGQLEALEDFYNYNKKQSSKYDDAEDIIKRLEDRGNISKETLDLLKDNLQTTKTIDKKQKNYQDEVIRQKEKDMRAFFDALRKHKSASKKVTAENMTLEDIEAEDNKDQVQEEIEKIDETPVEEIFSETTPKQYFEKSLSEDKVDTINDVVSKCIDKFSEKFKDFDKYTIKVLSYNTKVLGDYKANTEEMVEDKEINANAILQVILSINNNADDTNIKKVLAVFSITNGQLHWTGTVRGENDQVVAFTEEGLDALFEVNEPSEEELEDII